jgi:hypothetical protein
MKAFSMTVALIRLIARSYQQSRSLFLIPVFVGVALGSASPALASAQVCEGTLSQLQVQERK